MGQGRFVRQSFLVSLVTVAVLMAAPSSGSAAVTLGQTGNPAGSCGPITNSWAQTAVGGPPAYAVPAGYGVITSWSSQGASTNPGTGKLLIWRPTSQPDQYTLVHKSFTEAFAAGIVRTFSVRFPVEPNDVLGMAAQFACLLNNTFTEDLVRYMLSGTEPAEGSTQVLSGTTQGQQRIAISAQVEPDCDNDGFGDETQDTNLSGCAPGTTPGTGPGTGQAPTLPSGAPATCRGIAATIVGTNGSDARTGSQGQDVIVALGGNDALSGLGGNDVICGGAGKDALKGGKGKDSLLGQKGKDALNGGPSRDFCKGGKGTDTASKCEVEKSI
jgi:RTX calcium-binding nonapeptide repeat (4 copies)